MVYEANARIRDPVYGCAGAICQLQKQVSDLQAQLARSQAELVNVQAQHANLVALICMEMAQLQQQQQQNQQQQQQQLLAMSSPNMFQNDCFVMDEACQGSIWDEPLWVWFSEMERLSWINTGPKVRVPSWIDVKERFIMYEILSALAGEGVIEQYLNSWLYDIYVIVC